MSARAAACILGVAGSGRQQGEGALPPSTQARAVGSRAPGVLKQAWDPWGGTSGASGTLKHRCEDKRNRRSLTTERASINSEPVDHTLVFVL